MANYIGKLLTELREKAGFESLGQLYKATGVSSATLSRLENNIQKPTPDTLKKLAPHLKVTYEELMSAAGYISESNRIDLVYALTDKNTELIAAGKLLNQEQRLVVAKALDTVLTGNRDNGKTTPSKKSNKPILGKIVAGIPLLSEQNIIDYIDVTPDLEDMVDFGLVVHGDSMIGSGIHNGDIVLCKQSQFGRHGQIVVALVDHDQTTLKFFIQENGKDLLRAANPMVNDIELKQGDAIQGYVVKILKDAPDINVYRGYVYYSNEHFERWNPIIKKAISYGLNPTVIEQLLDMQIQMAEKIARKAE
ncbi:hypothetical protein JCM14036_30360 [Desulfotomaculum defluvii]